MAKYYLKELVNQPLFLPSGAKVPFEDVGGTYGILAAEDSGLIAELDKAVKNHIGGVMSLTKEQYDEWAKKKETLPSSLGLPRPRERESLGPIPFQQLQAVRAAGAAAVVNPPMPPGPNLISSPNQSAQQAGQQRVEPLQVPTQFTKPKPRVGKIPPPAPEPSAP